MEATVVAEGAKGPAKSAGEGKENAAPGSAAVAPHLRGSNWIKVSSNKKPIRFYVSLAKRIMQQHNEVVLSALGKAIGTVVKIAVILKTAGLATEKRILTSTLETKDESSGRNIDKAKIEILLEKTEKFDELMRTGKVGESTRNKITETDDGTVPMDGMASFSCDKI